jgi:SOS-response transcriptional repressor LexA
MSDLLENLKAIMVTGDSLEPIAKAGQKVLVRAPVTLESSEVKDGDLVIVETTNSSIGTVVKRIFHSGGNIQLVSSNPIDQHRPISIKREEIAKLWPLRGVILAE